MSNETKSHWPLIAIGSGIGLLYAIAVPFISPALRRICLPYVPATDLQTQLVMKHTGRHFSSVSAAPSRRSFIDLGSGDGRLVIAAAKEIANLKSIGVELNYWLVLYSRLESFKCKRSHLYKQGSTCSFYRRDIFKVNLSDYDVVSVFGVPSLMGELEKKLEKEMKQNGIVIAARFPLPNWKPIEVEDLGGSNENFNKVFIYVKKAPCL